MGYLSIALTTDMTLTWLLKRYRPDPADARWTVLVTAGAFAAALVVGRRVGGWPVGLSEVAVGWKVVGGTGPVFYIIL